MKCGRCSNDARYALANGELTCGLCAMKSSYESIRISDAPFLRLAFENHRRQIDSYEAVMRRDMESIIFDYFHRER